MSIFGDLDRQLAEILSAVTDLATQQAEDRHDIIAALSRLRTTQEIIMATLADVQAAVTAEDTVIDSAMALIQGLADKVAALAPNQAAIDALAADIKGKSDALAAAVAANTAAAPTP